MARLLEHEKIGDSDMDPRALLRGLVFFVDFLGHGRMKGTELRVHLLHNRIESLTLPIWNTVWVKIQPPGDRRL